MISLIVTSIVTVSRAMDFEAPEKGNSGLLALCIGKELSQVLHTLAHEFSHVMQWYEDDPIYKREEVQRREHLQVGSRHRTSC